MDVDKKVEIITRGLQEWTGNEEVMRKIIAKRPLKIYWGTAPTGEIHIGYFIPMLKIADFLMAGCEVTILIADIHAMLDKMKSKPAELEARTQYYQLVIKQMLVMLGIDVSRLKFVVGSSFQLSADYTLDKFRLGSTMTINTAKHAGSEVVKQTGTAYINDLYYPLMQVLDEKYLGVDAQFGGVDQRKIFMLSRDIKEKDLKGKAKFHFMNRILPGLSKTKPTTETEKMSASSDSKIGFLMGKKAIGKSINTTYCLAGDIEQNPILDLCRNLLFPIMGLLGDKFNITRPEEYGGDIVYDTYQHLAQDFKDENLHPQDLKSFISNYLYNFLDPMRKLFEDKDNKKILKTAYK